MTVDEVVLQARDKFNNGEKEFLIPLEIELSKSEINFIRILFNEFTLGLRYSKEMELEGIFFRHSKPKFLRNYF